MRADLHTHSTVSDGTESPADVMRAAAAAGLDVVALTDHDSLAGWDEAEAEASRLGMRFVPGVELSARNKSVSVHVLGYWPRRGDATLGALMARIRGARVDRAQEIVRRVSRDYPVTWEAVVARSVAAETVGRPHIADALVEAGASASRDDVFRDILHSRSPYYVPHYAPDVIEAVGAIVGAGGVAAIAHPGADGRGHILGESVIRAMARAGMVGIEIDHRDHDDAQRERLAALASRFRLVRTGSSDYHGAGKLNRLGENLTSPEALGALEAARS